MSIEMVLGPMSPMQTLSMVDAYHLERKRFEKPTAVLEFHDADAVEVGILTCEGGTLPCIRTNSLLKINGPFESLYIHNAQCFPDLVRFVLQESGRGVNCFVYAVDSDHNQGKVGEVWDLIPYAHQISKQLPICSNPRCLQLGTCSRMYKDRFIVVCPNCR